VELTSKPLSEETWPDFAQLVDSHGGVWNGCWCLGFHAEGAPNVHTPEQRRTLKETRVRDGRAHAALVYDGGRCVGWCQFGPTDELPRIKSERAYRAGLQQLPDWRITCFFVARTHRHAGVAEAALKGALDEIGRLGGGSVESYPEDTAGRTVPGAFLHNATLGLFERNGFVRGRQIGKHRWVASREVTRRSST
jgi:GNAT superfamily N-acetyltransferase